MSFSFSTLQIGECTCGRIYGLRGDKMGFWRKVFGVEERTTELSDTSGVLEGRAELLRA